MCIRDRRYTIKQMEKSRKALMTRLEKLNDTSRKDNVVTFAPPGDILRCGIKWEYFVQILMVEFLRDYFFDAGEIYHHS